MPVILVTDVLVWLLVAGTIGYAAYCRRHDHLAAPWRRVFSSRAAMMSLVVLLAYLAVGLADSLHFRSQLERKDPSAPVAYSNDVTSLLDLAVGGLRARSEKTYSAPFATRLYAKELIEVPGGKSVREYPRLRHGGTHLKDEADHGSDVATRAFGALAVAFMCWVVLGWALRGFARRHAGVPWGAAYLAFGLLLAVAAPAFTLSGSYHVLGTDKVGQDVFYLSLKSIRTSLVIGTLTTLVMLPRGAAVGIMAGYFRGWVDDVIQYLYTTLNSIPGVLLIAASVLMMQVYIDTHPELFPTTAQRADLRLLFLCIILGLTSWTGLARLLRGEALKLRELEYIQAAHAFGVSHTRIIGRHILPNVINSSIVLATLMLGVVIVTEASLSFLGVGVPPPKPAWGVMLSDGKQGLMVGYWWLTVMPGTCIMLMVLSANLLGDWLRVKLDPQLRQL